MIQLEKSGPTGSDCTASYKVRTTCIDLYSFVRDVLITFQRDWGEFNIMRKYNSQWYESTTIGYARGKLLEEGDRNSENCTILTLEEIPKLKILRVKASGGCSRMDYDVEVNDNE
uniref:Uncharacterized protein n=1 Tax=Myoviridae sp. ctbEa13 TaxID=2825136 RepID=A0A8S5VB79_9CAUD|nr:MAG TPA: hypothetical protein [Myoviridae sp. ctbEa13]